MPGETNPGFALFSLLRCAPRAFRTLLASNARLDHGLAIGPGLRLRRTIWRRLLPGGRLPARVGFPPAIARDFVRLLATLLFRGRRASGRLRSRRGPGRDLSNASVAPPSRSSCAPRLPESEGLDRARSNPEFADRFQSLPDCDDRERSGWYPSR